MVSASEYPEMVQAYLDKEVALGWVVGPVDLASVPEGTQLSPFGVIPKSQPGKWRLIVDLSSPDGGSSFRVDDNFIAAQGQVLWWMQNNCQIILVGAVLYSARGIICACVSLCSEGGNPKL